jgi:hypothetical protein
MADRRLTLPDKKKIRNLKQYKNMSEEEFEEIWEKKITNSVFPIEFEKRIDRKLKEFEDDYDLSDLKVNDKLVLRALIQSILTLEDLEKVVFEIRKEGFDDIDNVLKLEKISTVMNKLRNDISNMQTDLKITRKHRKGDKETSVINYLEDLKLKAKQFYESKMSYVFCPKCNMLLGTVWFLYPYGKNKLIFNCDRILENGEKCDGVVNISSKELMENRGTNNLNIPESMR